MQKNFENVALFLRLGLPSTLTRHKNAAFFISTFRLVSAALKAVV